MIPEAKLERLLDRFAAIEAQLAAGMSTEFVKLSKEHAELSPLVASIRAYKAASSDIQGAEALLADPGTDSEMKALATEEQVREGLEGNLCRCTGYENIVKSVLKAAQA